MSLPPLPTIPRLRNGEVQIRDFTLLEMQSYARDYGQQCRSAALDEAASMLETGELRGTEQDIHKIGALFISIAKYIRGMK